MTDRDTFAAAALTGLLAAPTDKDRSWDYWARIAYEAADAMLARRDGVTEPVPKEKRAEVSDTEPVAWAVLAKDVGATAAICSTFMEAERLAARSNDWRKEIVPLYRQPHPALTDAEREAVEWCIFQQATPQRTAVTLRGLLERIDGA